MKQVEKNPSTGKVLEVFGPTIEFLTAPNESSNDFCVLKGTMLPNVFVPLHSHEDTEDFYILSGHAQVLLETESGYQWLDGQTGDYFHVPSGVRHAWRNISQEPLVTLSTITKRLGHFFEEIGRPVQNGSHPPTAEDLQHFMEVSHRYGYWNASPEENTSVGIQMSFS